MTFQSRTFSVFTGKKYLSLGNHGPTFTPYLDQHSFIMNQLGCQVTKRSVQLFPGVEYETDSCGVRWDSVESEDHENLQSIPHKKS
jgi:hypothetical protein